VLGKVAAMPIPSEITIPPNLNGPARSANGGVAAGSLAMHLDGAVRVRLFRPPPLSSTMAVREVEGGLEANLDGETVMTAAPAALDVHPPEVTWEEAASATAPFVGHAAVTCVVCGPEHPGGLNLSPGPIGAGPVNATTWTPPDWTADAGGVVQAPIGWGVLDCPGAIMLARRYADESFFPALGTMTGRIDRDLHPGGDYIVVAWPRGRDGKKLYAGTAILDRDGAVCALSDQVCLAMPFEWAGIG
jgi:hypothetical protein